MSTPEILSRPLRVLGKDLVVYGLMGGLSRAVGVLMLPILTRLFSAAEYGMIEIFIALSSALAVLIGLTLESAVMRFWVEQEDRGKQGRLIFGVLCVVFFWGLFIVALAWLSASPLAGVLFEGEERANFVVLGAVVGLLQALSSVPQVALRMERRIIQANLMALSHVVLYVVLTLLLIIQFELGIVGALSAMALAHLLALILGLLLIRNVVEFRFEPDLIVASLKYSLPLLPAVIVTFVNAYADRIILLAFLGLGAVGIFGAAAKLAAVAGLVVEIFRNAWAPLALSVIDKPEVRDAFYKQVMRYYAGGLAILALILATFSRELLGILVPAEYVAGYVVVPWLIGAIILNGSGSLTNLGMLLSKRTHGNSIAASTGALVNISMTLVLIPRIGIAGAAIGAFVASFVFTAMLWWFSKRFHDIRLDLDRSVYVVLVYIAHITIVLVSYDVYGITWTSVVVRLLSLSIAVFVVIRIALGDVVEKGLAAMSRFGGT